MPGKPSLRAVKDSDEPAPKKRPTTLAAAADSSERDLLVMMRDKISSEIESGVPAHTLAPLMRQLREIDKEIRTLDARADQGSDPVGGGSTDDSFDASAI